MHSLIVFLALSAPPTAELSSVVRGPSSGIVASAVSPLHQQTLTLGREILGTKTADLQLVQERILRSNEFAELTLACVRAMPTLLQSIPSADDIRTALRRLDIGPKSEQERWMIQQGILVGIDIARRLPPIPALEMMRLTKEEFKAAINTAGERELKLLGDASVLGAAIVALIEDAPKKRSLSKHARAIVTTWFNGQKRLLRELDPIQQAMDCAVQQLDKAGDVMRVAYAHDIDATGTPTFVTWLILKDDASDAGLTLASDIKLYIEMARQLGAIHAHRPFSILRRAASEAAS